MGASTTPALAAPAPVEEKPIAAPATKKTGFQPVAEQEEVEAPVAVAATADEEEIPEPVKAVKPETPARSTAINNVLAAWGD